MAMTPEDITEAVDYFTRKNSTRLRSVQDAALRPKAGSSRSGGGSSGSGSRRIGAPANSGGFDMEGTVRNIVKGVPILGTWLSELDLGGGQSAVDQALEPMEEDQAPKNATQWILNALGTGGYATARFAEEVGQNVAEDKAGAALRAGDPLGAVGAYAEDLVTPFAGAARGVAEGLGARYDGQRPRTMGQNLESVGAMNSVREGVAGLGGDAGAQDFAVGAVGTAADILGDPLTFVTGTGLTKFLRGGASAATDALRAGDGLVTALGKGQEAGSAARAEFLAAQRAERALRPEQRAARKNADTLSYEAALASEEAAREAMRAADRPTLNPAAVDVPRETSFVPEAALQLDEVLPQVENTALSAPDPRLSAIDELLPSLTTAGRTVDAPGILQAATVPGRPLVDDALSASVRAALHDTQKIPELTAAVKSIKATPEGAAFLRKSFSVDGKRMTVGQALESAATRRITGGSASGAKLQTAVEEVLKMGARVPSTVTPESLAGAVTAVVPDLRGASLPELQTAVAAAPTQEGKLAAISQALDLPTEGFASFDDALKAAADGRVEASAMRSMLKALGIDTRATSTKTLREALSGQGRMNWDEIQKSIPTTREVLNDHGVTPATADAGAEVDPLPISEAAAGDYDAIVEDVVGFDPLIIDPTPTPGGAGTIGGMIAAGVRALDGFIDPKTGLLVERNDNAAWLATHRAMMAKLSKVMNSPRLGGGKGLTAAAREEFAYARWLPAMKAVTAHQASQGHFPRLAFGDVAPLYLSIDQIAEALPGDVIKGALFNLNYRLSEFGGGAGREQFKLGVSIYPTTIGNGTKAAIDGLDRIGILKAMAKDNGRNAFQRTKVGKQALADLAGAMDDPAFRAGMRELHEAQQIAAVAVAVRAADGIVAPLAQKIVQAVAKGGDRSEVLGAIREATESISAVAAKADGSLVRDLAEAHVDNGVLASLGELGTGLARADARVVPRASASTQLKAQQALNDSARRGPRDVPVGSSRAEKSQRGDTAEAGKAMRDDLEDVAAQLEQGMIDDGLYEADLTGHFLATSEIDQNLGIATLWHKVGRAFEGSFGMEELKRLQVAVSSGAYVQSHAYVKELTEWLRGDKVGGALGFGGRRVIGLDERLGESLGLERPANDVEINSAIGSWWHALSVHTAKAATEGRVLADDELAALLGAGAARDVRSGIAEAAAPLDPAQAQMALELHRYITDVFAPVDGPLARSGVTTSDMMREMARFGFREGGPFADNMLDSGRSLADQASIWRTFDTSLMEHPLDVLGNWHKALSAATVRPSLGASMSRLYDHTSMGLTRAEAIQAGFKKFDTSRADAGVAAYVDPESLFPPFMFKQMPYLNAFFEQMEKGLPTKLQTIVGPYDAVVGTLKSSQTIWNPSHHITNIMGEEGALVIAGVNPLYSVKAIEAIKAGGKLIDSDPSIIGTYRSTFQETASGAPATLKEGFFTGTATVLVRGADGALTKVNVSPEQVWLRALNDGSAITARESKDMLPGVGRDGLEGDRWNKFVNHPANVVARLDHRLGEFSAVRDNMTRLAHYYSTLEKGEYSSLEAAFHAAASDVHEYHPTIQSLSATDQLYTRRIIFFHTWVRQALSMIITTALERPAAITLPSKVQYNMAEAQGLEPESYGKPIGDDPRIPSYYRNGVLGPTMLGGYSPWGGPNDLADGEEDHQWGISLSSPQLDVLTTFFGGATFDGTPAGIGQLTSLAGALNPIAKGFIELPTNSRVGGIGGPIINRDGTAEQQLGDFGDYFFQQTGAPARIAGAMGLTPKASNSPAQQEGDNARKAINYFTGLKYTDYTSETAQSVAQSERSKWEIAQLREMGYDDEQIKLIRKSWGD